MRSTDEQMREIMKRADAVKEKRNIKYHLCLCALSASVCASLLIAVLFYIPKLGAVSENQETQRYGSLLLTVPYMGYVVAGVLAFALGICVTLFCIRFKELKEKDSDRK